MRDENKIKMNVYFEKTNGRTKVMTTHAWIYLNTHAHKLNKMTSRRFSPGTSSIKASEEIPEQQRTQRKNHSFRM